MNLKKTGLLETIALAALGLTLVGLFYTPYDPGFQGFRDDAFAGSSLSHWFGIDGLGRDFGSRLWRGAGHTAIMALSALSLNLLVSAALLFMEQTGPAWLRRFIPLVIAVWVAVPVIFIGLVLLVFFLPSAGTLIVAAAIGNVPMAFRQLRIIWLEQRNALYVQATEVLGGDRKHLLTYTLWPNLLPDLYALGKLIFAIAVLELSGLAYLGLIGDPDFPELGSILRQNQAFLFQSPLLVLWPGFILSGLLVLMHASSAGLKRQD